MAMFDLKLFIASALMLSLLSGCGEAEASLEGSVTANGKAVQEGFVSFMPVDPDDRTYGALIKAGKFSAQLTPGNWLSPEARAPLPARSPRKS